MDDHKSTALATAESTSIDRSRAMNPLVQRMLDMDQLDPATMREMLALQREWEAGEAKRAYTAALVDLHRDLPRIIGHDKSVSFDQGKTVAYTHTSMAKVAAAVVPVLHDHGFTHSFRTAPDERGIMVIVRLTHRDGHSEESCMPGPPDRSGSKSGAQAAVSTATLLKRHCLLNMLGIETKDMAELPGRAEPSPAKQEAVDPRRNMNALRKLKGMGITQAEAEAEFGPLQAWTAADRARMGDWVDARVRAQDEPEDAELVEDEEDWGKSGPEENPPEDAR